MNSWRSLPRRQSARLYALDPSVDACILPSLLKRRPRPDPLTLKIATAEGLRTAIGSCAMAKLSGTRTRADISRRRWLTGCLILLGGPFGPAVNRRLQSAPAAQGNDRIESVTGPIAVDELGITLMHEHVLVDFIGASSVSPARYDAADAFKTVLPHLQQLKQLGCGTLVECTPAYLGRDPRLLKTAGRGLWPAHPVEHGLLRRRRRQVRACARVSRIRRATGGPLDTRVGTRNRRHRHQTGLYEDRGRQWATVGD